MQNDQIRHRGERRSRLGGVLREPLVHFLLLTGALFGIGALFGSDADVIRVSRAELDWRIMQVEAQEGPLTAVSYTHLTLPTKRIV